MKKPSTAFVRLRAIWLIHNPLKRGDKALQPGTGPHLDGKEVGRNNLVRMSPEEIFHVVRRLRSGAGAIPCRFKMLAIVLRASL